MLFSITEINIRFF